MTISLLGILMVIATIIIFAYIGIDKISLGFSSNMDKSTAYDQLAILKSEFSALKIQYDDVKREVYKTDDKKLKKAYINAELEFIRAESAISDVESAISSDSSIDEINARLDIAKAQLQKAKTSITSVRAML